MLVRGGASLTSSVDGTIEIPIDGSAGFTWNANSPDGTKHAVSPAPMVLGTVSFTLGNGEPIAFAVYSADDQSLDFYKRLDVPDVGDTFNGKVVTKVYTGFEDCTYGEVGYTHDAPDNERWSVLKTNVPWFDIRESVTTVKVIDSGVAPKSLKYWFYRFSNLKSADLSNLEASRITDILYLFVLSVNLISIKMPGLTSACTNYRDSFSTCYELISLEMPTCDFSNCNDFYHMFYDSKKLKLDCSDWNVPVNAKHENFNFNAPGVILPKPWQPTAFAVFSAEDKSLDFYKREFKDMPKAGETFEGTIVTNVYTGFEESRYMPSHGNGGQNWLPDATNNTPWFSHHLDVTIVSVIDEGIRPKYLNCWFQNFQKCRTFDLNKLDMSNCSSLYTALSYCTSATDISVSSWDVSQIDDFTHAFLSCESLETLDLSGWNTSSAKIFHSTFNGCSKLKSLLIGPAWNFSHVWQCRYMFSRCANLTIDCSEWDVSGIKSGQADELETSWHFYFNYEAPGVILPKPWQAGAFAIYSADDGSLDFYKRSNCELPVVGSTFESKTITSIYTGFETQRFVDTSSNHGDWTSQQPNTPWWGRRLEISSANVVDTGIRPSSVDYWFYGMENLKTIDVANLDTSSCDDFKMTFGHCGQIETIDLSAWSTASLDNLNGTFLCCLSLSTLDIDGWNTSKVGSFHCLMYDCKKMSSAKMQKVVDNLSVTECANDLGYLFNGCEKLTTIDLSSWNISNVTKYMYMFFACYNLTLDCSNWNVRQDSEHENFNSYAPSVILPKAWQPTAFAVFSADDKSLNFYKREYKDMPKVGDTFNNKTVSEVYSDIEDYDFKISYETDVTGVGNAPWWNHRADILYVKVVDRIRPKKTCAVGSSILRTLSPLILGRLTRAR